MKIFLIRHAESTSDVEDRYGGDYNDHLTEEGKEQAQKLAVSLQDKNIEIVYSSPKFRARETAEIVVKHLGRPLEVVDDLRERNAYGIVTGMVKAKAGEQYPDEVAKLGDYRQTVLDGEEYGHFKQRVIKAYNEIRQLKCSTVAIITHGGPIRCLAREVLDLGELAELGDCATIELEG